MLRDALEGQIKEKRPRGRKRLMFLHLLLRMERTSLTSP